MFDEVNYLYEVKLLSDHTPVFFSQGPVMYYAVLPFFQLFHSVVSMKLSILLLDFIVLVVLFFALKRYDESLANGVSLFYILSPMSVFLSHHVTVDVPALLFIFLSIFFWVRFHDKERSLDLFLCGLFVLLSGLTKETDFFLYAIFLIYLVVWHWKVGRINKRLILSGIGLVVFIFLIKAVIMTWLWDKNPSRMGSIFLLIFNSGSVFKQGLFYYVMTFFLFVNPITALLGYPRIYSFFRQLIKRKSHVQTNFFFKLSFISGIVIAFLVLFFTFYGVSEARFAYYITPFLGVFAVSYFKGFSGKVKALLVIIALVAQFWLVVQYEKDTEGSSGLASYLDRLPGNTIFTDKPERTSEHFIPSLITFKTQKSVVYLSQEEIAQKAKNDSFYVLSYNRTGIPLLEFVLKEKGVQYEVVSFLVADYNREVYALGPNALLEPPIKTRYYTFFTQPLRTPVEEWIFQWLIRTKRSFCSNHRSLLPSVCGWVNT